MRKAVKFGGSSLASAARFQQVRSIIEADPSRSFVVVSAPGRRDPGDEKITDLLYRCQANQQAGAPFDRDFNTVAERFLGIERELSLDVHMERELRVIRRAIDNGASADYAASRGEYLCALLLSAYLGFDFVDATELICFHEDGAYDDETTQGWASALEGRERVVIPGFYGRKRSGQIRTFSRGGSDITGAIVARAVQADEYENWTDVDGFLMADPRIVDDPKIIEYVSYAELRELSYMGATVLHEDSIFPVRKARIPIHVRNTFNPTAAGTHIVTDNAINGIDRGGPVTGIAGHKGFTVITLTKDNLHSQVGFIYRLLGILKRYNVAVQGIPSGIDTVSLILSDDELRGNMDGIYHDLKTECSPDTVEIASCIALITTVGRGMVRSKGVSARLFRALYEAGVNVRIIDQGSSEMNIIVGVEQRDFERAIRAIYKAFA